MFKKIISLFTRDKNNSLTEQDLKILSEGSGLSKHKLINLIEKESINKKFKKK